MNKEKRFRNVLFFIYWLDLYYGKQTGKSIDKRDDGDITISVITENIKELSPNSPSHDFLNTPADPFDLSVQTSC